jgi:photosystem II stability/assembly factor-like uncharacterized protein
LKGSDMNETCTSKALVLVIVLVSTSCCFAMRPTRGWISAGAPSVTVDLPLGGGAGVVHVPTEITAFTMDGRRPFVLTKDGKILRLNGQRWEDVTDVMSNYLDKKVHVPSKFKAITGGQGQIFVIDEDGRIYQWADYN